MAVDVEKKRIKLRFLTNEGSDELCEITTGYSRESLFSRSDEPDGELVRLGAGLSFSAGSKELLAENLAEAGFKNIRFFGYDGDDPEKIGLAVGMDRYAGRDTVAVVLRSTRGKEWYSNFDTGYKAEHKGFSKAADFAEDKLCDYIYENGLGDDAAFFVTGYSRGGAVADILAKRLSDRIGTDGVKGYTFAAPNTVIHNKSGKYCRIFDFVRREDFFTRVPPESWGYEKYGRVIALKGDIAEGYERLAGEKYIGYSSPEPVDEVIKATSVLAPNIRAYYERRYEVGKRRMSLFEYFSSVADMLAQSMDELTGEIMMDGAFSRFGELSAFLSAGADISYFLSPGAGIPRCSVADSHSPAAYLAAINKSFPE